MQVAHMEGCKILRNGWFYFKPIRSRNWVAFERLRIRGKSVKEIGEFAREIRERLSGFQSFLQGLGFGHFKIVAHDPHAFNLNILK